MELADIIPVFNKHDRNLENNYRPIIILPNFSKVFEKIMHFQVSIAYPDTPLKCQCSFRKGFTTQPCLIAMIE